MSGTGVLIVFYLNFFLLCGVALRHWFKFIAQVLQLLHTSGAPPLAWLVVPLALAVGVLPSLCVVLTLQVALMRIARGRWIRAVLNAVMNTKNQNENRDPR